ncbi:queuosine precursor transporter [Serratia ureilytica]|uniref:queuosine precursor transporter n=1 Tax=Serratia TaxID=613 RepID=UPI00115038D1|nr:MULTISPECIES: queuosine precursor transporter [Serratia]MBH3063543.1 queuosine precursor transporter [Serratia ureilytica]MBJ2107302.1 queuosine precursor transporter [Serratia ureilytica]QDI55084.1 queuosine precursor transporter [Serratia marcescens]
MDVRFILVGIANNKISYKIRDGGAVFSDNVDSILHKNLVDFFSEEDKSKILASYGISDAPVFLTKGESIFTILLTLFITCLFVAIPLSQTKVAILSYIQPGGIIIFPITFVFLDSINEIFGRKKGKLAIITASVSLAIASIFIFFSLKLKGVETVSHANFIAVYTNLPRLLLINSICVLLADNFNNIIYNNLKAHLRGSYLLFRCFISTIIGQLVYSIVWILAFYHDKLEWNEKITYILNNYEFKVIFSLIICAPLTLFTVWLAKTYIYGAKRKLVVH